MSRTGNSIQLKIRAIADKIDKHADRMQYYDEKPLTVEQLRELVIELEEIADDIPSAPMGC